MTTRENRPNTALLVIDVQENALARAHEREAVIANVGSLVEQARREGVPGMEVAVGVRGWFSDDVVVLSMSSGVVVESVDVSGRAEVGSSVSVSCGD